jgi:hypothetical protein
MRKIDQEQMRFVTHNDVSREDCGKSAGDCARDL